MMPGGDAHGVPERNQSHQLITRWVDRLGGRIHAAECQGPGPTIVLMHGFPDDLHLYDYLIPLLAGRRRVVAFDFLGGGSRTSPRTMPTPRPARWSISMR